MRQVLFRGKRIDNGEWVYGAYINMHHNDGRTHIHHFIIPDGSDMSYGVKLEDILVAVDGETVCQYTGLTDKNGKKIFEGDILEVFGIRGRVVQECGAFGLYFPYGINYERLEIEIPHNNSPYFCYADNYISLWELWWNYEQDDNPLYCAEIIGNVYENEELLEAEP